MLTARLPTPIIDTLKTLDELVLTVVPEFSKNDLNAITSFLKQYTGNNTTFESYRREIERLLQWSWLIEEKSLLDLQRSDIENYIKFCLNPPKSWIGFKKVSRFVTRNGVRVANPSWRPFVATVSKLNYKNGEKPNKQDYQLSQKSIREIFTILGSFYHYLTLEEKTAINPVSLIKQKSKYLQKRQQKSPVMRLSENQWQTCFDTVKELADKEPEKHERTLFIISALYLLYLRISELIASERWIPQMNHFYKDSQGHWWFKTVGKGNKMRDIAVADDMLCSLIRYRKFMGLTALPSSKDKTLLLPKEKGNGPMTSSRHIRRLVQYCFDATIQKLREKDAIADADAMESATVHWLRHTGISDDINKRDRPVAHVRDDAGHSSSAITDRYNDIDLIERHLSAKNKKLEEKNKN